MKTAKPIARPGTFTQVSTGVWHTCGVKTDETVVCWGRDDEDQSTPL